MANRPIRRGAPKSKSPKSQSEINRIKPVGTLSLAVMEDKSNVVNKINVKMPDGEIYEFYHLPMTTGTSEDFVAEATTTSRVKAVRRVLTELLVNQDGTPLIDDEDKLRPVAWKVLNAIFEAINKSDQEQAGED